MVPEGCRRVSRWKEEAHGGREKRRDERARESAAKREEKGGGKRESRLNRGREGSETGREREGESDCGGRTAEGGGNTERKREEA